MAVLHWTVQRRTLKKVFTFLMVTQGIMWRYASPIPHVTLGEIFLFVFWVVALIDKRGRLTFLPCFAPLCVYLSFHLMLEFYNSSDADTLFDGIGTTLRVLFYLVTLAVLAKPYFDFAYGVRLVRGVAVISAIYALIQTAAFKIFGVFLSSFIPFLPPFENGFEAEIGNNEWIMSGGEFRAWSFFSEPSHVCAFLLLALALELFLQRRHWAICAVLLCVTCFVDRSSTGIVLSIFLVARFYLLNARKISRKRATLYLALLLALAAGSVVFIAKSNIWAYFIWRTFRGEGVSLHGLLMNGRFRYWNILSDVTASPYTLLFGLGASEPPAFLPGSVRILYYWGLVGLTIYIALYGHFFRHAVKEPQRTLVLLCLMLEVIGGLLINPFALTFTPFLLVTDTGPVMTAAHSGDIPQSVG